MNITLDSKKCTECDAPIPENIIKYSLVTEECLCFVCYKKRKDTSDLKAFKAANHKQSKERSNMREAIKCSDCKDPIEEMDERHRPNNTTVLCGYCNHKREKALFKKEAEEAALDRQLEKLTDQVADTLDTYNEILMQANILTLNSEDEAYYIESCHENNVIGLACLNEITSSGVRNLLIDCESLPRTGIVKEAVPKQSTGNLDKDISELLEVIKTTINVYQAFTEAYMPEASPSDILDFCVNTYLEPLNNLEGIDSKLLHKVVEDWQTNIADEQLEDQLCQAREEVTRIQRALDNLRGLGPK